jgi:hypothetical protein
MRQSGDTCKHNDSLRYSRAEVSSMPLLAWHATVSHTL